MSKARFTEEFKVAAVKQVAEHGRPVAEVAARLGVSTHSIYGWLKRYNKPTEQRKQESAEAAELKRLRTEVKRLTEERDILKKAAVDSTDQCNTYVKTSVHRDLLSETYETQKTVIYTAGKSIYF